MKKKKRIVVIIGILVILVGYIMAPRVIVNMNINVYRTSAENPNRNIQTYKDMVSSEKNSVIQPYEYPNDMQYIVTVKCEYDSISVSAYKSEQREWKEVDLVSLGNEQYSIAAIPVFYNSGYASRTVTYCISIGKGDEVKKYYFTTKE